MQETVNYGLKKQGENEFYDVNVINDNLDTIDRELKNISNKAGDLSQLSTIQKTNLVGAINEVLGKFNSIKLEADKVTIKDLENLFTGDKVEGALAETMKKANAAKEQAEENKTSILELKQSVSSGKQKVATAITDKGVSTGGDASFDIMAGNIRQIKVAKGNAQVGNVLSGKTFTNDSGTVLTGTMPILTSNTQNPLHYMTGAIEVGQLTPGVNNPCVYFQIPQYTYTNGIPWIMSSVPDLRPESILSGKSILGVIGNVIAGKRFASGSAVINTNNYTITVSGLAFTPSIVLVGLWHSDPQIQQTGCVYNKPVLGDVCFSFTNNSAYKLGIGNSPSSTCYVMNGGFRLPGTGTAGFGGSAYWTAFE